MSILDELLQKFPELTSQKKELARILATMEHIQPQAHLDARFVQHLRTRLTTMPHTKNTFSLFSSLSFMQQKTFMLAGAALTLAIALPLGYTFLRTTPNIQTPTHITPLAAQAFGDLGKFAAQASTNGQGGGGSEKISAFSLMSVGGEYTYAYAGNDLASYLTKDSGMVYERAAFSPLQASTFAEAAPHFPSIDINHFLSGDVTQLTLRSHGYLLSIDGLANIWNIYHDWTSPDAMNENWEPIENVADLPSDENILAAANALVKEHGIDTHAYDAPFLENAAELARIRTATQNEFIPGNATVVFPSRIDGGLAYYSGSWSNAPIGLRVSINLRDLSLINAYDALSQSFTASSYALTQDVSLIEKLIAKSGFQSDNSQKTISVENPEHVLIEYPVNENGTFKTLYIPGLRFATSNPSLLPGVPEFITIPLVKTVAEAQASINEIGVPFEDALIK